MSASVKATLDGGTLTISGTGAMADYTWDGFPWYDVRESIVSVVIENGVTTIGNYAFSGCTGLASIEIPDSVTSIGSSAFSGCTGLTSIISLNPIPPTLSEYAFGGINKAAICPDIPENSIAAYKSAAGWNEFACINAAIVSVLTPDRVIPPNVGGEEAVAVTPSAIPANEFVAGPNVVSRNSGAVVNVYCQGQRVENGVLTVYDGSGNTVNRIAISDNTGVNFKALSDHSNMNPTATPTKRIVGSWDLRDKRGRMMSEGTYLIRGMVIVGGKQEKVSLLVNVR